MNKKLNMNKNKFVVFVIGIIFLCVLSLLLTYIEWSTLLILTIFFGPLFLVLIVKKIFFRVLCLFSLWALLFLGVFYFNSLFTHIIIVNETKDYSIKKVPKGSEFTYIDSEDSAHVIVVSQNCVYNNLSKSLRLYDVSYSRYQPMFGGIGETEIMLIPPHSVEDIPRFPDYIMESPPSSILVTKRRFSSEKTTVRTVLDVVVQSDSVFNLLR